MIIPRKLVRDYLVNVVGNALSPDVGDRIYEGRPNPVPSDQLPCVWLVPFSESMEKQGGTDYIPMDIDRKMNAVILIVVEPPNDPSESTTVQDRLDEYGRKLEKAMKEDRRFQKLLDSWSGQASDEGVLAGSRLITVDTDIESGSESPTAVMQLVYELLREDTTENEKRWDDFQSYLIELRRVGWDASTVDPILIAAEGDVEQ
jgi:hypothetical protein